ncbi:response regulator [Desulfobacterales bacterium HSG16]|nr:response regulator [Desulfobacterales bacterium HSG16]
MYRIMVADDSWLQRKKIGKFLQTNGFEVIEAVNGKDAVEKSGVDMPDCILLDLLMPEMDGIEVLRTFQQDGTSIPVIIFTADIQDTSRARCFELGATDFINKPIDQDKMLEAIQKILDIKGDKD